MSLGAIVTARIGTLAGGRVYCMAGPQGVALPYIFWTPIASVPQVTQQDYAGLTESAIQVDCCAATAADADALRTQVLAAMCDGHDDTNPDDAGRMLYEDAAEPAAIYDAQADFTIFHPL
jgi:hypothetical protein